LGEESVKEPKWLLNLGFTAGAKLGCNDQWHIFKWRRAMTALYDDGKSPFVVEYVRETP
jgi:hypothetical protein